MRLLPLFLLAACDGDKLLPDDTGGPADDTAAAGCSPGLSLEEGMVRTSGGVLQGVAAGEGWGFLGVPFVEAPVGERRFAFPEPFACRDGEVMDADALGSVCPQPDVQGTDVIGDEDCLHLNVWTPEAMPLAEGAAERPVMFFIHGGGNVQGSTAQGDGYLFYDGGRLAEATGAVVVTTNYRLGALGFMAHEALTAEYGTGSGNLGLRDQLAALDWVQENIAAFGGDPARVMVFGESAGGLDTCMLYTSPLAAGKLSAALIESASCPALPLADREAEGADYAVELGCAGDDVPACLRALPWADLAALSGFPISDLGVPGAGGFGTTIDGEVLPMAPNDAIEAGQHNDVPLVLGSNSDETAQWVGTLTRAQFETRVETYFGAFADQVLALYPEADFDSGREAWIALTTDASFTCPARSLARRAAESQQSPVWRYVFTNAPTGLSGTLYGAWHGLELAYVFQGVDAVADATGYAPDAEDYAVEALMGAAWGNLAWDGAPDSGTLALDHAWPQYDPLLDNSLEIGGDFGVIEGYRDAQCDFWGLFGL
ncbi:MAG: carboxylesterase family protein [Alphaproteobacteria bacterium]|nr:carboxylesterase family protein [Alphaproteobacteria bacterium]